MGSNLVRRAVFLDRDGVINPHCGMDEQGHPESPLRFSDFKIFPDIPTSVRTLNWLKYLVFVASNQPAYAKGKMPYSELIKMNNQLKDQVIAAGGAIQEIYYCLHHPDPRQVKVKNLLMDCDCRKPKPGLLYLARMEYGLDLAKSWMIGDSWKDIEAGRRAGCRTILISEEQSPVSQPDFVAKNLAEAVEIIEEEE